MTINLQAAAYTEARRKALEAINQSIRDEGRRTSEYALCDRRKAAAALVASNPKWLEAAAMRLTKITSSAQKSRR